MGVTIRHLDSALNETSIVYRGYYDTGRKAARLNERVGLGKQKETPTRKARAYTDTAGRPSEHRERRVPSRIRQTRASQDIAHTHKFPFSRFEHKVSHKEREPDLGLLRRQALADTDPRARTERR